jgi:hypothetical protein
MPSPDKTASNERGMALALALFALVIIGGIVGGNFFAGMLEQQSGRSTLFVTQATEAAEAELRATLVSTSAPALVSLAAGGASLDMGPVSPSPGLRVERQIARLTGDVFLIRTRGIRHTADGTPLATGIVGLLVRVVTDSLADTSAVVPLTERAWVQLY